MKLLHTDSDKDLFILRPPGQTLAMQNLQDPKLKKTYCYLKALKNIMKVGISSYSLKKVLLLKDFTYLAGTAKDKYHLLAMAISHPHLRPYFLEHTFEWQNRDGQTWEGHLNVDAWKKVLEQEEMKRQHPRIPLTEVRIKRITETEPNEDPALELQKAAARVLWVINQQFM